MKDLYQISKILKCDIITIQNNIALLEYIYKNNLGKNKLQIYYYLPTALSKDPFYIYSEEIKNIEENYKITNNVNEIIIKDSIREVRLTKRYEDKEIEVVKDYENEIKFDNLNSYFKVLFNLTKSKDNTYYDMIHFNFKENHLVATTGYSLFIFHNVFSFQKDLSFSINFKVFEILSYLDTDFTLYYEEDNFKIKSKNIEIVGSFLIFPNYIEILNDLSKKEYLKPIKVNRKDLIKYIKELSIIYGKTKIFSFYINNRELFIEDINKNRKIKIANTDNDIEYRNYFAANYLIELIKDLKDKDIELYLPVELTKDYYTGDPLKILGKDYSILLMPFRIKKEEF